MKKILNSETLYKLSCKLDKLKCDFNDLLSRFEAFILQYPIDLSLKADLVSGKVPAYQLPSYVDDVITGTKMGATTFVDEITGVSVPLERGKIYVDIPTGLVYRWTGTMFVEVSPSTTITSRPSIREYYQSFETDITNTTADVIYLYNSNSGGKTLTHNSFNNVVTNGNYIIRTSRVDTFTLRMSQSGKTGYVLYKDGNLETFTDVTSVTLRQGVSYMVTEKSPTIIYMLEI